MSIAVSMNSRLNANSTVNGIIAGRLYPAYQQIADKVYPAAVYKIENVQTQMSSTGPTGLVSADFVVACIDKTYAGASQLADAVQAALDGTRWADSAITVQGCFLKDDGREEDLMTEQDSESLTLYITQLTFELRFNAAN